MRRRLLLPGLAVLSLSVGLVVVGGLMRDGAARTPRAQPVAATSSPAAPASVSPDVPGTGTPRSTFAHPRSGVALPDGFVPRRLQPGERPPQFVVVSFDGVGWHREWRHWMQVASQVPFRFTGFLSGPYLLSYDTRDRYHPPYYAPGTSEIGWGTPADLRTEIADLNHALSAGMEIGTHFNGHFCASAGLPSGGDTWSTRDWDVELDQFFHLVRDYRTDNALPPSVRLHLRPDDVAGGRTPCLEGRPSALYPALAQHGFRYDSSITRPALTWPTRDRRTGLWQIGMTTFPLDGTAHLVTTMDYNYFFTQRGGVDGTVAQARADQRQVLATYDDLYRRSFHGNRAPVILGNHFNDWNHDAYVNALTSFVLGTCGRTDTECVPFRDLVAWLDVQTPQTLARLSR